MVPVEEGDPGEIDELEHVFKYQLDKGRGSPVTFFCMVGGKKVKYC